MSSLIVSLLLASQAAAAAEPPARDPFLANLVGCWRIDGQMGETALRQRAIARPVLDGHFVEVRVEQTDAPPPGRAPYAAIYLIGFDASTQLYVMNLFDTFGVASAPIPGVGARADDQIAFRFAYRTGEFLTDLRHDATTQSWTMDQRQRQADGSLRTFAVKRWSRCPSS